MFLVFSCTVLKPKEIFHCITYIARVSWENNIQTYLLSYLFVWCTSQNTPNNEIGELKSQLAHQFEIKDLGTLCTFWALKLHILLEAIFSINPNTLPTSLIKLIFLTLKPRRPPWNKMFDIPLMMVFFYQILLCIVLSLVYLTISRLNIAYVVHVVNRFVSSPTIVHWTFFLCILRYLHCTQFQSLLFPLPSSLELCAYSDANWASDPTNHKSTTRFCIFLGESLISWKRKKQTVMSRSSTKVEYRAMSPTIIEIVWLRWLLDSMGVSLFAPTPMH